MSASQNITNNPIVEVVALALRCSADGSYLLARRGPGESGAGEWEFPGGKIEPGETQRQALQREIAEELGLDISGLSPILLGENLHQYPRKSIKIYLWEVVLEYKPILQLIDHDLADWFQVSEIAKVNLSAGDKSFISLLNT